MCCFMMQARSLEQLDSCLDMLGELPHQGNHLADVKVRPHNTVAYTQTESDSFLMTRA